MLTAKEIVKYFWTIFVKFLRIFCMHFRGNSNYLYPTEEVDSCILCTHCGLQTSIGCAHAENNHKFFEAESKIK